METNLELMDKRAIPDQDLALRSPKRATCSIAPPMIVSVTVFDADFFSSLCVPLLTAAGGVPRTAGTPAAGPAAIHPLTSSSFRKNDLGYNSARYCILFDLDKTPIHSTS